MSGFRFVVWQNTVDRCAIKVSILSLKLDELEQITELNSYRGIIDQFETINIDPSKACEMVAAGLVKKGLFEDAIKMFDLAGVSVGC